MLGLRGGTVRKYTFRALLALDPPACQDAVRPHLDGTRSQCVVQPGDGKYFPAHISDGAPPVPSSKRAIDVVLRVPLLAGEAQAYFATGRPFTVWADAIVDDEAIRGKGLLGGGVILSQEPTASRPGGPIPFSAHRLVRCDDWPEPDGVSAQDAGRADGPPARHHLSVAQCLSAE
jgi:hypothetical protein